MLIHQPDDLLPSEITPPEIYRERRRFMQGMGALAAFVAAADVLAGAKLAGVRASAYRLDDDSTPYRDVTTYNNFYEFGTGKGDPAKNAGSLKTRPWTVAVEGRCAGPKPGTSKSCSSSRRWRNVSTACAASKAGRW